MIQKMLSLPVEKKIGQLFFIGLPATELDNTSLNLLEKIAPGGICLFARNVRTAKQVRNLLENIRENSEVEPFLSLDQEGGLVDRLRRIVTPMPAANLIKTNLEAKRLAEITAELIRILGFNMNFAPVVDVVDEKRSKFSNGLFSRAFGKSKEDVTELAGTYFDVLQENGCIATLKHFPGIGATELDSHEELPIVNINNEIFFENDLFPYKEFLSSKQVHSIMIGHTAFPKIDLQETDRNGKLLPSSLSKNFISKLLRQKLGFQGIAITDDLEMGAIMKNYGIGEACKMAINAGNDMLAICAGVNSIFEGYNAIFEAFENGEITEDQIDTSINRIAKVKSHISQPLTFELQRIQELSDEVAKLNQQLKNK